MGRSAIEKGDFFRFPSTPRFKGKPASSLVKEEQASSQVRITYTAHIARHAPYAPLPLFLLWWFCGQPANIKIYCF